MKKRILSYLLFSAFILSSCAQNVPATLPAIEAEAFSKKLEKLLSFTVPVIGVQELAKTKSNYLVLDAREKEEFKVSHIPGATFSGYKNFDWSVLDGVSKDQPIVLYCSVGYRSEKMAEDLMSKGYSNVSNLYGSLFEWANEDLPLVDENGNPTKLIHTYNAKWSKWVEEGELIKVW